MSNFMDGLKSTLNDERSVTENGAVGFRTTGRSLLDLNFAVASLRSASEKDIQNRFSKAFFEDKLTAMKWLFYARDVRGGLGERRLFRACMVPMAKEFPEYVRPIVKLIPEYGRWDDLWCLLDTPVADEVMHNVSLQLTEDNHFYEQNQPISLLAKWMPRCKCRNKDRRRYATMLRGYLNLTERDYQHTLSALCRHLKVVEMDMSAQNWDGIDYQRVPSRANLQYNSAFLLSTPGFARTTSTRRAKRRSTLLFCSLMISCISIVVLAAALTAIWKCCGKTCLTWCRVAAIPSWWPMVPAV